MTLNVCMVGPIPPPAGGMAMQTQQLVRLLKGQGVSVSLVATNAPYRPEWVANVPFLRALFRLLPYVVNLYRQIKRAEVVHLMANSGWSWHLFAMPCLWMGHLLKTPVIVNYRGGHAEAFFQSSWRWVSPSLYKAHALYVPSGFLQEVFAKYGVKAEVIPNILDTQRFTPTVGKTAGQNPVHCVSTRNLEDIYGNDTVLRAFAIIQQQIPGSRLTIAGSGPEQAALQTLTKELGLQEHVTFCGRLSADEMVALYQAADILLNGSRVDNSPNSLIEAMACGVPVVSTNVGGIPYLISHNENGFLVKTDDHQAMAECAISLVNDVDAYGRIREAGLTRIAHFQQDKVLALWLRAYRQTETKQEVNN